MGVSWVSREFRGEQMPSAGKQEMRTLQAVSDCLGNGDWKVLEHSNPFSAESLDGTRALSQADCCRHFNGKRLDSLFFTAQQTAFFFFNVPGLFFTVMKRRKKKKNQTKWGLLPCCVGITVLPLLRHEWGLFTSLRPKKTPEKQKTQIFFSLPPYP